MGKPNLKIFLCILFTSGYSQQIEAQYRPISLVLDDGSGADSGAWIPDFDYPDIPVSNLEIDHFNLIPMVRNGDKTFTKLKSYHNHRVD